MAEASFSVDQSKFICPVCLKSLKDPVVAPCGHCFCKVCINDCWDNQKGIYRCRWCGDTFTPWPALREISTLAEKELQVQTASPAHCYAGPGDGDVECDFCTVRKQKAVKSCVVCLASLCETHLKAHYEVPVLKEHKLIGAPGNLEEKICSEHHEVLESYCRTDQSVICYLCLTDERKGRETVTVASARADKQSELKEEQMKSQQRIQEKQKTVQELKQAVNTIKLNAEFSVSTVDDTQNLLSEPKTRDGFMKYFCDLTLDPNTVNYYLILSEKNRAVTYSKIKQTYSDHPERFDSYRQVLSKESVCGRCYWEVEWSSDGGVFISVSYKHRKESGNECVFGYNNQSWSLHCSSSSLFFWHNNIVTDLRAPSSSRIGVYVDHSAGTLSFYSISDTMKLLHRVHTTFTQPLYAGFWLYWNFSELSQTTVRLCHPK